MLRRMVEGRAPGLLMFAEEEAVVVVVEVAATPSLLSSASDRGAPAAAAAAAAGVAPFCKTRLLREEAVLMLLVRACVCVLVRMDELFPLRLAVLIPVPTNW